MNGSVAAPTPQRRLRRAFGLIAWCCALASFAALALAVASGSAHLYRFDTAVMTWMHARAGTLLVAAMYWVSWLGAPLCVLAFAAVVAIAAWRRGRLRTATFVAGAVGGGEALNALIKLGVHRLRPPVVDPIVLLHTYSFPSGHALGATMTYGAFALIARRRLRSAAQRAAAATAFGLLVALVGASRIVLRVHYPSDVLAGLLEGAIWIGVCARLCGARLLPDPDRAER